MADISGHARVSPSRDKFSFRTPWARLREWLGAAPITDPVDRRNAPAIQLLLLFYGLALPANWIWILSSRTIPPGWGVVAVLDFVSASVALACVAMIRRGAFRTANKLFLAAILCTQALAYYKIGAYAQLDASALMLILIISGLVLGRRALWTTYLLVQVVFLIGWTTDYRNADSWEHWLSISLGNTISLPVAYGIVAIVLDRTVTALRESLAESESRGNELKHEMAQRERAQSQLIHAQKLEATGQLASGIAHDFNNILDVVTGFAGQRHVAEEIDDDRLARKMLFDSLEGVETAARRGSAITGKLLGFSRSDLLKPQTFDLRDAVADLQPMLRQLFPPSVRLSLDTGDVPLPVHIDRSELEMMLLNVAANARDAMHDGGRFDVRVHAAGGMAGVDLADSGHGMDAQVLRQIFEPFFSTKAESGGTGLGLSVIQDLVRAAGGDIHVASTPARGTTFTIQLPLASERVSEGTGDA